MSAYLDRTEVRGFGDELILYKRADLNVETWWYRAKIEGHKGYIRRSTKETELAFAERKARDAYIKLLGKSEAGLQLNVKLVRNVVKDWFAELKNRKLKTEQRYKYMYNTWYRYMDTYFGEMKVSDITDDFADGYWNYRLDFYKNGEGKVRIEANSRRAGAKSKSSKNIKETPSYPSLRAEAAIINEFFKWCHKDKNAYIAKLYKVSANDAFSTTEQKKTNRRPAFTRIEYQRVRQNLNSYAENKGAHKAVKLNNYHLLHRQMLRAFVLLMGSTGLRVGEAKQLRWRDLRKGYDAELQRDVQLVSVRADTSKVGRDRTAAGHSEHIISVMDEWKKLTEFSGAEDLIFYNKDKDGTQKICDMSATFKSFLKAVEVEGKEDGLLRDVQGKARTLYSLRHTYATFRLEQGVEVYALAKVMGTGIKMIEKHYGHVAGERLVHEVIKGASKKETQEARDVRYAAEMIAMLRAGDIQEEDVAKKLISIAKAEQ